MYIGASSPSITFIPCVLLDGNGVPLQAYIVPATQIQLQIFGFCGGYSCTGTLPDLRQICQGLAERQVRPSEPRRGQSDGGLPAG